ncbi:bifunctional DNA-formamidopyrimidine glycosylase/DNA-(apurinic or apyrimidinic site) lyase [Sanguibacter suaedae]|uniref:Bifunctional DNA-formamidopyrimidine glycosylase/DNA-(Apurinic or apyrimidinic site) lyase n=1 Tax=Sanguibacter suaedae TaxID=2795737 RepID=A0A934I3B1_9MICO|nr:bifunctional DNA-formamidopyrimidine glycosylase/DNA-(apurinic or apyrimidinic site) lyase [Sanguibacter suaedae]MBI9114453.1 bifunctional DNA-formamidopyrimidine glycosylase/DNA-(apurinic or apyrimidinic site) lyase [Sanguibacter suaedae]
MPELPEVETVRDGLERHVLGSRVRDVHVLRDYSVRRHEGGPLDLVGRLRGRTLVAAARRGKYLWVPLDDGSALLAHLGMSGQLLVRSGEPGPASGPGALSPHLRVRLDLDSPTPGERLTLDFVDQRTFGHLSVCEVLPTPDGLPGGLGSPDALVPVPVAHIARDLLDPALTADGPGRAALVDAVRRRRTGVKRALLDQTLVSGIGNIYADEALWRAQVHFARSTQGMPRALVARVLAAAEDVMREALHQGGTSFDALYVNVNGASGYFDRSLAVYGQEGRPCRRCGAVVRRDEFMNRSSFSCPVCQRAPRKVSVPRRS